MMGSLIYSSLCCRSQMETQNSTALLGLGSNIGDREENLVVAVRTIGERIGPILRTSSIYETEPVGYTNQPWFLNQVIEVEDLQRAGPGPLLDRLLAIEQELGRRRVITRGPRNIDIDLLLYGDVVEGWNDPEPGTTARQEGSVIVPHPHLHERRFVLIPLGEIAPDRVHPVLGVTMRRLLEAVGEQSEVRPYQPGGHP